MVQLQNGKFSFQNQRLSEKFKKKTLMSLVVEAANTKF